jgi:hypothetical protein
MPVGSHSGRLPVTMSGMDGHWLSPFWRGTGTPCEMSFASTGDQTTRRSGEKDLRPFSIAPGPNPAARHSKNLSSVRPELGYRPHWRTYSQFRRCSSP